MVVNKVIADKCKTTWRLDERVREGSFVIENLQDENRDRKPGKGKTRDNKIPQVEGKENCHFYESDSPNQLLSRIE